MDFLNKIWEDVKQHPIIATALAAAATKVGLRNGRRIGRLASNYKAMKNAPVSYGVVASDVSPVYGKINGGNSNSGILRTVEDLDVAKAEAAAYPGAEVVLYIEKPTAEMTTAVPARIFGEPGAGYNILNLPFMWDPANRTVVTASNYNHFIPEGSVVDNPLVQMGNREPSNFELAPGQLEEIQDYAVQNDPFFVFTIENQNKRKMRRPFEARTDVDFLNMANNYGRNLNGGVVIPDVFPITTKITNGLPEKFFDLENTPVIERLYTSPRSVWRAPLGESRLKTALRTVPFNWARDVLAPIVFGGLGAGAAGLGYGAYKLYDYLTGK